MQEIDIYDINGEFLTDLVQWDKDVYICIEEENIDKAYQVHFFNKESSLAFVVDSAYTNGVLKVKIPNKLLMHPHLIAGYINIEKNGEQKCIYGFKIVVHKKPQPSNTVYEDTNDYIRLEVVLQECRDLAAAASNSADAAKVSETNAKDSEDKAKVSEINAKDSEVKAKDSEDKANVSETNAKISETNSKVSEIASKDSENKAKTSEVNAKDSEVKAKDSENKAKDSEDKAKVSETNAKTSETNSKYSEDKAKISETNAKTSEENALQSSINASASAQTAASKADESSNYADISKSYAIGEGDVRTDEDIDNAKYYCEQAKRISQALEGALMPMGTITFEQLPDQVKQTGYMYNISNKFVSDVTFKDGSGHTYPAGTNVYCTADGFWDCLPGTMVTGVKGNSETSYRIGDVNITPANIGLGNVDNTSDVNKPVSTAQQNALNLKVNKSGDTMTGDLTLQKYLIVNAWTNFGTGSAKMWYNGNTKTLDFEGDVQNIDLNATSANKLNTNAGSGNQPVYFSGGIPVACNYTISKSVPSNAVFTDTTYSVATQSANGLLSAADKKKLDGIASNAQVNSITGVKGNAESTYRTGQVNITPANIGLGSVNNTADANKNVNSALIVRGTYTGNGGAQPPSYVSGGQVKFNMMNQFKGLGLPTYADCILMDTYTGSDVPWVTGFGILKQNAQPRAFLAVGAKGNSNSWHYMNEIITTANISSQVVSSATTASKLGTSNVGSATQPIYLAAGVAKACTYTLSKSVPSNAVFTDTTYSIATQSANGLLSAADKKKLDGIASSTSTILSELSYEDNELIYYSVGVNNLSIYFLLIELIANYNRTNNAIESYMLGTNWTKITFASGYTHHNTSLPAQARQSGSIVELRGAVKNNNAVTFSSEGNVIGYLPSGIGKPAYTVTRLQQGSGANKVMIQIKSDGSISAGRYGTSSNIQTPAGSWINIACVFMVG